MLLLEECLQEEWAAWAAWVVWVCNPRSITKKI
jgi:hypothetical protein